MTPKKPKRPRAKSPSRPTPPGETPGTQGAYSLVIVESPAKARTIQRYLGPSFRVSSCMGHIRDLPRSKIGIDVESGFRATYTVPKNRKLLVQELKKSARKAQTVYLAPDPDREGEAIAWHLSEVLELPLEKFRRVTFHEITAKAIQQAFEHPTSIDPDKVNAQQARRILDRLVGYKLSPLLWKKIAKRLSAGRVQSVAVRLIVEREREITDFRPEEYWKIAAQLLSSPEAPPFQATLVEIDGEAVRTSAQPASVHVAHREQADAIAQGLHQERFQVAAIQRRTKTDTPPPPFITSTLQQQAANRMGFTTKKTMRIAQDLYEGMPLGDEGPTGLITYMRTDSVRMAPEALAECRQWIQKQLGDDYLPAHPRAYRSGKGAQEAHECIRPTSFGRTPQSIQAHLQPDQFKLYRLIWNRAVASQTAEAKIDQTTVHIKAGIYRLNASGSVVRIPGYHKITPARDPKGESPPLPVLQEDQALIREKIEPSQHFTQPLPHYTEASLVRTLEKLGIGRPSTYAPIISTIQDRGYVVKREKKLQPTELGTLVTDKLLLHFPNIMDVRFTSQMEDELDQIEGGKRPWQEVLDTFYRPFVHSLERAQTEMQDQRTEASPAQGPCQRCGKPMVIKWSRRGRFLACSGFPECRNTQSLDAEGQALPAEVTDRICPLCSRPMAVKMGRYGKFLACSGYPDCRQTQPMPTNVRCPKEGCTGELVQRRARKGGRRFYGCSKYPDCDYITNTLPEKTEGAEKETKPT
jgi:DNA topoisomerase-1